ncbi:MAG: hypothetical protein WC807_20155 [Hyphomicrobium sp.]|jgi:hypothetical protein
MRDDQKGKMPFVAPVRLRNMLWLPVVAGVVATSLIWGTPHVRVQYSWNGLDASPYYHSCRYWGLSTFELRPIDGNCPLFILARTKREG